MRVYRRPHEGQPSYTTGRIEHIRARNGTDEARGWAVNVRGMNLPRVVLTSTITVDGRITMGPDQRLIQPEAARRWATVHPPGLDELLAGRTEQIGAKVTFEGSGSFVDRDAPLPRYPVVTTPEEQLWAHHLPRRAERWFVVADSRGRVDWSYFGDEQTALLLVVCRATPPGYLQMLRDQGVGYLVAGDERVDLSDALGLMREVLGADLVVADSGGEMNASLLRAGLVDELDVITLPGLVGGLGTPSLVDGPPLGVDDLPIRLELLSVASTPSGLVRSRYRVI